MIKPSERAMGVEYAIRDVVLPARELEKKGIEVIRLNIGDPPGKYDFQPPEHMKEAYCRAIKEGHNYYGPSEGLPEMREAVVQREKRKNGVDITPPMTSASQLPSPRHFSSSLGALLDPGDNILVPSPSYPPLTPVLSSSTVEFQMSTRQ
ncbi:aminotransferase class I/II-fold pyridoxal phosphate-dependent enzyme [Thermococcus peptonophilus]|uniref:aminotransferase class I/II-fold pyridoxal phosphate-dependent enzyme n=1 Tax=Thermococcus peptonophilus TaxID=53952 RepID=UPI000A97E74C